MPEIRASVAEAYPSARNLCYPYLESFGLMDFTSIAFHAAQFALYTHPSKIYLVGCDCSNGGYFDGSKQRIGASHMVEGWKKFKEYLNTYYPDVEIISVNPVGLKGLFKDIYTSNNAK